MRRYELSLIFLRPAASVVREDGDEGQLRLYMRDAGEASSEHPACRDEAGLRLRPLTRARLIGPQKNQG
jgi:hypothetical protein